MELAVAHWRIQGGGRDARPPWGPNSFIFMQFSAENLQNNPNLGLGAPPRENPGSATVWYSSFYVQTGTLIWNGWLKRNTFHGEYSTKWATTCKTRCGHLTVKCFVCIFCVIGYPFDSMFEGKSSQLGKHGFSLFHLSVFL